MPTSTAADTTTFDTLASLRFAADALPWQRSLRWAPPPRNRRRIVFGVLLSMLVTLIELAGFSAGMRPYRQVAPVNTVIQVQLIEPEPVVPPPPPEPEPPEFVRRPSRIVIAPPEVRTAPPPPRKAEDSDAMSARIGSAGAVAPPPKLFNPDGSIRLGGDAGVVAPPSAPKSEREAAKARWAEIERRGNPIDCKKTRFARAFTPDESAGDAVARKYLKWIGLYDGEAVAHRQQQRAEAGGCEPAP